MCELSKDAVNITKKNAASLDADVTVECGDFITPILEKKLKFDVLLCNPPYIKNSEVLPLRINTSKQPRRRLKH